MRAFAPAPELSALLLLTTSLLMSPLVHAERCCRIAIPEIRFQANSVEPLRGIYDLGCVVRSLHADSALSVVAVMLRENPTITLGLVGHSDVEEKDVHVLSLARARWVACMLVSSYGVDPGRLSVEGKGDDQPRFSPRALRSMIKADRVRSRLHNRRVEFRVTGFAWVHEPVDGISAVRFLSDPATATRPAENFCDQQQVAFACGSDTGSEEATPSADDPLPASSARTEIPGTTDDSKMTGTAPSLLTNPIDGDRIIIVGLPNGPTGGHAEILTLDGRSLCARSFAQVQAAGRVTIDLPSLPAASAYIVRVSVGAHSWSLRFVKP